MVNEYDSERSRDEAFARWQRRQRIETWLARVLWVAGVAWFVCWIQAGVAEDDFIIEACKGRQTFECMDKAAAEYRKNH